MRLGIDIGGTTTGAALVLDDGQILAQCMLDTRRERPYNTVIDDICNAIVQLLAEAGVTLSDVESLGIGCPGIVDQETGTVLYSNNFNWKDVPLARLFQERLKMPVAVANDANCAAWGEHLFGASCKASSSVMITLGTGVGGGIILNGRLHGGFNAAANVVGHMVIASGGKRCSCGRQGCFESYASVTALIEMAKEAAKKSPKSLLSQTEELNGRSIFAAAAAGDESAQTVLSHYFLYVAEGIANIINILQPQMIVVGGGISAEGEVLLAPVHKLTAQRVYCKEVPMPQITAARLGNNAGLIGAAFLNQNPGGEPWQR